MNIEDEVMNLKEQMRKDKDFFWNHPEKGLCEFETSSYIKKRLEEMGYNDINTNIYATGIICNFEGKRRWALYII